MPAKHKGHLVKKKGDVAGYKDRRAETPQKFTKRLVRNTGNCHGKRIQNKRKVERRKHAEEN